MAQMKLPIKHKTIIKAKLISGKDRGCLNNHNFHFFKSHKVRFHDIQNDIKPFFYQTALKNTFFLRTIHYMGHLNNICGAFMTLERCSLITNTAIVGESEDIADLE